MAICSGEASLSSVRIPALLSTCQAAISTSGLTQRGASDTRGGSAPGWGGTFTRRTRGTCVLQLLRGHESGHVEPAW